MRELAVLTFVTLDGVMQGVSSPQEDTSGQFTQGGWAMPYWEGVMAQVRREAMAMPYDMLFGRKTYQMFAANRPQGDARGPVDKMMDEATKYVVSSTLAEPAWKNTLVLAGDGVTEVSRLKKQDGPLLQIHGSWQLMQTLMTQGLIDEFRVWTFPLVVGPGKRLFEHGVTPAHFKLIKSASNSNGAVMNFYRLGE